ncbi:MAG: DUF3618 domain-containing protein [Humibacillus sp.]|nr:DUF3618 domain-containing protein [Humibacillus sp.]MDN5775732.1 DUF3618 domain-containing protein [Humibacillus sp.]
MSNDPDQIRAEIEATRAGLSSNVNALTESVKPGNVVRRQVGGTFSSLKDQVMGSEDSAGKAAGAKDSVMESASSGTSTAAQKTRGNPLAAGVIAFGAGLLLGSLLPTSEAEQQAAATVKDKAAPLTDHITDAAKSVATDLKEPATEAAQNLKAAATDAANTVKDEAQSTASDVKASSADAAEHVKNAE